MTVEYTFTKTFVDIDRLTNEINASTITIALISISTLGAEVSAFFKAYLSSDEEIILANIIVQHSGQPLPVNDGIKVISLPEGMPFALPTFRTKRNATGEIVTIAPNTSKVIDYLLTEERYVSGGTLLVENGEFGDYVTAEVCDPLEVIPVQYRVSLCENWPTIAKYIEKEFVEIRDGTHIIHKIDTYPLNAKITAGLCLRLTYHAINSGNPRNICVNYNLTKKL